MKLHENKTLFRQAISGTAESMQIPEIYIEKDYWVTRLSLALKLAPKECIRPIRQPMSHPVH